MSDFISQQQCDELDREAYDCCQECGFEFDECDCYEDDGQPSMYEEYQDLYGGDDWNHGQHDDCF
jgi:hypothetical protein